MNRFAIPNEHMYIIERKKFVREMKYSFYHLYIITTSEFRVTTCLYLLCQYSCSDLSPDAVASAEAFSSVFDVIVTMILLEIIIIIITTNENGNLIMMESYISIYCLSRLFLY